MTIKDFYEQIGGNYDEAMERFMGETLLKKFLKKFPKSPCYQNLCNAMEAKDYEQAFRAVHSMKGVTANMAFSKILHYAELMTEELRNGQPGDAVWDYFEEIKTNYAQICDGIDTME